MENLAEKLKEILGEKGWVTGAGAAPWQRDWLNRYGEMPLGVARPNSTAQVAQVMAACHAAGVVVVPQGGNTGLCGAAVLGAAGGVILQMSRMAAIAAPDPASGTLLVEAGVVLAQVHAALEASGQMFPLHLGAEGSAQIGGLIGTNAGGSQAFRYGMMSDLVLGLEVVFADGTVWDGLRAVQKDNAGYALRRLFCGAEGSLGIVTRAVLRLHPEPAQRATALLALPDMEAAVALGLHLRAEMGEFLAGLEFFSELGLSLALKHVAGAAGVPLEDILGAALEWGMEAGLVSDGALATSEAQRAAFWRLREEQPEGQRLEGPQLKHDISVPPGRIAAFVSAGAVICQALVPGVRINPVGHLGDGNIHYNLTPREGASDFAGQAGALALQLARLATGMVGSFAAEHGLGRAKIGLADALRPASERGAMRAIKRAFDPAGLLNPGVILAEIDK